MIVKEDKFNVCQQQWLMEKIIFTANYIRSPNPNETEMRQKQCETWNKRVMLMPALHRSPKSPVRTYAKNIGNLFIKLN